MYRPIDLNSKPFNYNINIISEYREPLYLILFFISLSYLLYITFKKKYKLYIIALVLYILYGLFLLPKKKIYLLEKQ